jgi:hypothetical protein
MLMLACSEPKTTPASELKAREDAATETATTREANENMTLFSSSRRDRTRRSPVDLSFPSLRAALDAVTGCDAETCVAH